MNNIKIKRRFSNIKTLIAMQLRQKLDMSFLKSKRSIIFKSVFAVVKVVIAVLLCYGVMFLARGTLAIYTDVNLLALALGIMLLVSLISCIAGLNNTLFESNDNVLLFSFPVKPNDVFVSKLTVFYIYELIKNIGFFLGLFFAYGIYANMPIWYYPIVIVTYFFLPLLPVSLGALLSIPVMIIRNLIDRYSLVSVIFMLIVGIAVVWLAIELAKLVPEEIRLIGKWHVIRPKILEFVSAFANYTWIFKVISGIYVGVDGWLNFAILCGICIVLIVGAYLLARPLFFAVASVSRSSYNSVVAVKKNKSTNNDYLTILKKELINYANKPMELVSRHLFVIAAPVIIYLLNVFYNAMPTRGTGDLMQIAFNLALVIVVVCTGSVECAKLFSQEGNAFYILKSTPSSAIAISMAKITVTSIINVLSCIACSIIIASVLEIDRGIAAGIGAIAALVSLSHILWSVDLDLLSPQLAEFKTGNSNKATNEGKSIGIAIVMSVMFGLMCYWFSGERFTWFILKLIAIACVLLGVRIYLNIVRLKHYFSEIE